MANRFVVDLGDMKLDAAAKRQIANAIQAATLGELAKLDGVTSGDPFAVFDPVRLKDPRWWGIIMRKLPDFGGVPGLEAGIKDVEKFGGP